VHERYHATPAARPHRRAMDAEAKHRRDFVDRLLVTFGKLRHGAAYKVLVHWFGVNAPRSRARSVKYCPLIAEVIDRLYTIRQAGTDGPDTSPPSTHVLLATISCSSRPHCAHPTASAYAGSI
jgi:hypothetical protein